jgi:hypothetical protein
MSERAVDVLNLCHQRAHQASTDPEEYVFLSLTEQEVWFLLGGAVFFALSFGCLEDEIVEFQNKIGAAIDVQMPQWTRKAQGEDA